MRAPRRYAELSAEHRFWLRLLPSFLAPAGRPSGVVRALHGALVVPNVVFVSVSAEYQTYLALIFHRSTIARVGHVLCVPAGIALMIASLARLTPAAGVLLGSVFAVWWTAVGVIHRRAVWALLNAAIAIALTCAGMYLATHAPAEPVLLMIVVALLQSGSHATETHVPPRVASDSAWVPLAEFVRTAPPLRRVFVPIRSWLYGAFDEWWATPRLVHVGTLLLLFRLGYAADLRDRLATYVRDALESGDPALDYIGEGGGAYLDPRTLEPRT